ncbi:MAG: multidrug efflux RND transporter permease subunit, partial [Bryobacteraceae bacterium]
MSFQSAAGNANISEPFIRRPVATTLLTAALAFSGAIAYNFLPVAPLPQVDFPALQVRANLPGASPETMASSVATPLERQFGRIAGLNEMTSSSTLGSTNITLEFDLSRDINAAARDVQAGINAARGQLPANLPTNPTWRLQNPADPAILQLSLTSDELTLAQIYDAASTILQQRISQIHGVGQVFVGGSSAPAVRVDLNPTLMNHFGLSLEDVRKVLAQSNALTPTGDLSDSSRTWSIGTTSQLMKASQYAPLVVAYHDGAPVKLSDIGDVDDNVADVRNLGIANDKPAVLVYIFRQPQANIIDTTDQVKAVLPELRASIPAAIDIKILSDRTTTIRASVADVQTVMSISIGLVILVGFLFLRSLRTTLVPAVVVPVSLIGTFGVLYLCGYSIDNLSLLALTIATGFVVDDAIVVIENIARHVESGMRPLDAALTGAREIGFTVLSISIALIAVFLPILLMGGIVGRLFREFAVALSAAIVMSLAISLTVTPTMCARLLVDKSEQKHGRLFNASERAFNSVMRVYEDSLAWVLSHQPLTLMVTLATVALTVYLYIAIPKGFFPQQDTARISGQILADQSSSYQAMRARVEQIVKIVMQDPAVDDVNTYVGGGNGYSKSNFYVSLKPLEERGISTDEVIYRLRPKLQRVPGANLFMQSIQDLRIGGRASAAQYQYTLQSDNVRDLNDWAPRVYRKLKTVPQLTDVNTDQQDKGLEASLVIDRATASRLGISSQTIDNTLYDAFGQREVSVMYTQMNQYFVVMEVAPRFWQNPDGLKYIYVPGTNGAQVPLSAFTHYEPDRTPLSVNHQGQFPSVTISFNLHDGVSLSEAVPLIEGAERDIGLPSNVSGSFQGTAQAYQESIANEPILILAAIISVYLVLGMLYEDLIHPITILSTLPSAGVGALLALMFTRNELNVISLIGIFLLIGLVMKNAILMIDFAIEAERRDGLAPIAAIFRACQLRFRPITMTTTAALLGGLPVALGRGVGSELRRPLGIAIVGGLVFSQLLTVYTTPVVYLY